MNINTIFADCPVYRKNKFEIFMAVISWGDKEFENFINKQSDEKIFTASPKELFQEMRNHKQGFINLLRRTKSHYTAYEAFSFFYPEVDMLGGEKNDY